MGFLGKKFCPLFTVCAGLVSIGISPIAYANLTEDVVGSYTGNIQYSETFCSPPPDGAEVVKVTLTITKVAINNFQGEGKVFFSDGEVDAISITFTGITPLTFNFSWASAGINNPFVGNGSGSGSVISNGIIISGSGSEVGGQNCTINFSGTLFKITGAIDTKSAASSAVTDAVLFNILVQGAISDISSHITGALSGMGLSGGPRFTDNQFKMEGATGLNAGGDSAIPYGVWGNYAYTNFDNDLSSTAFDGNSHSLLGGVDFGLWKNTVLGVAVGYDNGDIDTTFNEGHQDTDSYTIAPYFGALLSDTWSIDFTVGYTKVDYDQFRTDSGLRVSSTPDADRWFGALNLNGVTYRNNWILGGRIGALWAKSTIGRFVESNGTFVNESRTTVGTASVAVDVAYSMQNNFEPFLNLSYQNDFSLQKVSVVTGPQPSNDPDDILMTVGVRYFNKEGITGNLEFSKRLGREDFSEDRVSVTLRVDF